MLTGGMRRLLILMALAAIPCAAQGVAGTGSISGRVLDAVTNASIPGAKIVIGCMTITNPTASCYEHAPAVASDGTFRADGLPAGSYLLIGIADKYFGPHITPTVIIEAGHERSNVVVGLLKAAVIRGRVLGVDGKPLPGIDVEALALSADHRLRVISSTKTDSAGAYGLDRLTEGKYFLAAQKGSVRFFFPSAVHAEDGQPVQIDFGEEYLDANIRIRSVPLLSISGRIADFEGVPNNQDLSVRVYSQGPRIVDAPARQSPLTPDGRFHFYAVVAGDYALVLEQKTSIEDAGRSSGFYLHVLAKEDVTLGRADLTGITLIIPPRINLTGRVVLESSNPGELSSAKIMLRPQDIFPFSDHKSAHPSRDGSFVLPNCEPARYSFQFTPPPGTYIEGIEYNRQPVTTSILDFTNGIGGELVIQLERGTAALAGTVPDDVPDAYVYLIPDGWQPDDWRQIERVLPKKHSFLFTNVAPGRYSLVMLNEQGEDPLQLAARGQTVELNAGDQKKIELTITPAGSFLP